MPANACVLILHGAPDAISLGYAEPAALAAAERCQVVAGVIKRLTGVINDEAMWNHDLFLCSGKKLLQAATL
jgi:hypothetical protein